MSALTSAPDPAEPPEPRAAHAERALLVLDRITDLGLDHLENLRPPKTPDDPVADKATRAEAFDRVARALRRGLLLADHFAEIREHAENRAAARREIRAQERKLAPRPQRSVPDCDTSACDTIDRDTIDRDTIDQLDGIADLKDRPIAEIATKLTRASGLADFGIRPHADRAPEDVPGTAARHGDPNLVLETILKYGRYPRDG